MSVVALSAGLSDGSSTTRLALRVAQAAAEAAGTDAKLIELRAYAVDSAHAPVTGFPSPRLQADVLDLVASADVIVAGTPVFHAMPGGLFIEFFNVLDEDVLAGKPVGIVATGGSPRHSLMAMNAAGSSRDNSHASAGGSDGDSEDDATALFPDFVSFDTLRRRMRAAGIPAALIRRIR